MWSASQVLALAVGHFCFSRNIEQWQIEGGENPILTSAWEKRHNGEPFSGPKFPFGCLIDFKPTPVNDKTMENKQPKFSPNAVPGLFLGYFVSPGGRWRGDFLVTRLTDFKDPALKKVQVQRVKEVYMQPCSV